LSVRSATPYAIVRRLTARNKNAQIKDTELVDYALRRSTHE
jgi:hypothetical protein